MQFQIVPAVLLALVGTTFAQNVTNTTTTTGFAPNSTTVEPTTIPSNTTTYEPTGTIPSNTTTYEPSGTSNGTGPTGTVGPNVTSSGLPIPSESQFSGGFRNTVNAGLLAAVVAGGIALTL